MTGPMSAAELVPGTLVGGDFRVETVLARGGMGVVYVALQESTQKRRALKVMSPQPGDADLVRTRFEREAHVASQIESEHVVQVIGAGVDGATAAAWIAMELLDGEDLESYLGRRGRLDWIDGWNIVGEMTHALEAAHRLGVVHRDLKPSNVFLARSRRPGVAREVKILDFGIAKRTTDAGKTTGALGTPLYMAPEQTMAGAPIAPATDVWALGLLCFELFVGRSYWRSASDDGAQMATLLREVILEPLPPASTRAAELFGDGCLPQGFDAWFARCVVRDVAARFSNAGEAYRALAPILAAATGREDDGLPPPSAAVRPMSTLEATRAPPPTAREARTQQTFATPSTVAPRSRLSLLLAGSAAGAVVVVVVTLVALRSGGLLATPPQAPSAGSEPVPGRAPPPTEATPAPSPAPPPSAPPSSAPLPSAPLPSASPRATPAPRVPRPTASPGAAPTPASPPPPPETSPPAPVPAKDPVIL